MNENLRKKIESLISSKKVFLFMKGTPNIPECGFSARVVEILNSLSYDFSSFNVLEDESIREGIKEYASWPTIPQLYVNGKFVGGCDIVDSMASKGELQKLLQASQ